MILSLKISLEVPYAQWSLVSHPRSDFNIFWRVQNILVHHPEKFVTVCTHAYTITHKNVTLFPINTTSHPWFILCLWSSVLHGCGFFEFVICPFVILGTTSESEQFVITDNYDFNVGAESNSQICSLTMWETFWFHSVCSLTASKCWGNFSVSYQSDQINGCHNSLFNFVPINSKYCLASQVCPETFTLTTAETPHARKGKNCEK